MSIERIEVLSGICMALIECVADLAKIISEETDNPEAMMTVASKLGAFSVVYSDQDGDGTEADPIPGD